jgi:Na+/H+ antiporter NhaD/arsenite permease-like protein
MLPFVALVLSVASLPVVLPHAWEKRWFQASVVAVCSAPVLAFLFMHGKSAEVWEAASSYATFVATLGALFVTAGGVFASGDLEATPRTNVIFLLAGSVLASIIGTTGASVLVIRPLLRTNSQREHTAHIVPFFILAVANAGGLLTPLGDPPLLIGFIQGVPFFWTLRLLPVWLLYVGTFAALFYIADRRAFARESAAALARDRAETVPLQVKGAHNLLWLGAIVGAAFLPPGFREAAMLAIGAASYFGTSREVHQLNDFSFGPILEVALIFSGLFACLVPIESGLSESASKLPLHHGWQLFWASGALSSILDNAPTYAAFAALARGLSLGGGEHLVAGMTPALLTAISAGSVVMGATTYIGNGPNLIMKAIAERSGYALPSFTRFAIFAFSAMLPAHLIVTFVLGWLER